METRNTILIISENPDLHVACRQALAPGNFSVQSALSLQDGLCTTNGGNIDILLLDAAILPDPPGANLLSDLWAKDADLVCLILSERPALAKALQAIQAGAHDVIRVPLIPELLLLSVTRAMEKRLGSLELKRLQAFEQDVSRLWSVAKGELDAFDQFDRDFLVPAAFRLTVAHEFRAPLTALQSFLLLLLKGYVPPEQHQKFIQHALDRSQGLLELVDDLMDLATARQDLSSPNRSRVRLGEELEKAIPTLMAAAGEKGLTLTLNIRQNPMVEVNALQMGLLWTNLISNAIKYTPPDGHIRVFLDQDEKWAIGTVEDTGIGIAPKDQALIFHEFYRAVQAKKMEFRGTGLGLPLVKRIVEGYGGRVEVESTLGEGSRFCFTLPLATASQDEDRILSPGVPQEG